MPSKLSSPFLAFACVGKIDGNIDFVAGVDGEGGSGSAISVATGKETGNINLTVLNNFNSIDLSGIKW